MKKYFFKKNKYAALSILVGLAIVFSYVLRINFVHAASDATLYLNPGATTVTNGASFTVDVTVNPGSTGQVNNVDLYLAYDQNKLSLDSITSTNFPIVVSSTIPSPQDGTASFSAGTSYGSSVTTSSVYATLHFHALATTTSTPITIVTGTNKSGVYSDTVPGTNLLGNVTSGTVTVNSNWGTGPGTSGYSVSGNVSGLSGTLPVSVSSNSGSGWSIGSVNITANGTGTFMNSLNDGDQYRIAIASQPSGQTCVIGNNSGTISGANVSNVTVTCQDEISPGYLVSGTVSGLSGSLSLTVGSSNSNAGGVGVQTITANGSDTFLNALNNNDQYTIAISAEPAGQICTIANGAGIISNSDVSNVAVQCVYGYSIGGTISGLNGTVQIYLHRSDEPVFNSLVTRDSSQNGQTTLFDFVSDGVTYQVGIYTQPTGQTCTVTNGSGTISGADVNNVAINCVNNISGGSTGDVTPPVRSQGLPSGILAAGTTSATMSLVTDEAATCKYATAQGVSFASMSNAFSTTGGTTHTSNLTGLANGTDYHFFIKCNDVSNNANTDDFLISFSIANSQVTASSSNSDSDSKKDDPNPRYVHNSKSTVTRGSILVQSGVRFSQKSALLLYFAKPGGGYYAPTKVNTTKNGTFSISYKVNKPAGKYGWYAVDTKNNRKSKTIYYKVK